MPQKNIVLVGAITAVLLANVAVLYVRFSGGSRAERPAARASPEEVMRRQQRRADLVGRWSQAKATKLASLEGADLIEKLKGRECKTTPPGAERVSVRELTDEQQRDLGDAIDGLVNAYIEDTPSAVIAYMNERNESPKESFVAALKKSLVEDEGMPKAEANKLSAVETFKEYCGEKLYTNWSGIAFEESCLQLWHMSGQLSSEAENAFGREHFDTLSNVRKFAHAFEAPHSLDAEFNQRDKVLFADARMLIKFSDDLLTQPCPHYVRFWYSSRDQTWHPIQLARSEVDREVAADSYLLF